MFSWWIPEKPETATVGVLYKKLFLFQNIQKVQNFKILEYSLERICVGVSSN